MKIKSELLKRHIWSYIDGMIENFDIDEDKIADATAIEIVKLVQGILKKHEEIDEIEMVEEIVKVFEKYGIDTYGCHDYY